MYYKKVEKKEELLVEVSAWVLVFGIIYLSATVIF